MKMYKKLIVITKYGKIKNFESITHWNKWIKISNNNF